MLFSQTKERANRFLLSLKIAGPFVFVLILFSIFSIREGEFLWQDIVLLVILFLSYVYYIVYLVYFGFKTSLIDPVTGVFLRAQIIKILDKKIKKRLINNLVLIKLSNIIDINDRYGHKNGDEILRNFVLELANFMEKEGFRNLSIGTIIGGSFIFGIDCDNAKLNHILNIFKLKLLNKTINNVETKTEFVILNANYDKDILNTINTILYKLNHKDEEITTSNIDINDFEYAICSAIDRENYGIKTQIMRSTNGSQTHSNFIPRLISSDFGDITKSKIINIIFNNQYDIKYDINLIKFICKNIYFRNFDGKIFIEIFATTIRNVLFKQEILKLVNNNLIDPSKVVFEFNEESVYEEIHRFSEIIDQFKDMGFSFALNKFGSANASFEYFKYLNIDFVIYDMEYNKNLNDIKINKFFKSMNKIAKDLGIQSVVRFVDKETFYNDIKAAGVDFAQGFYIQKPVEIEKINS